MALSSGNVFEIRSTATSGNVNAGGFNPTNANMLADLTTDANTANTNSPVVSSASYNFVAGDVSAWLYIKSGTNWTPGWYQIASVATNKATLSATIGLAILNTVNPTSGYFYTNTSAGCATVGTPTSGTFTIDYSQQNTAQLALSDFANVLASTSLTTATGGITPVMRGNLFHLASGTNSIAGWYEIVNTTDTNTATIDRTCATGGNLSSGVGKIGGALSLASSDDAVFELGLSGNIFFAKGGSAITYTIGGTVSISAAGGSQSPIKIIGYNSNRTDRPTGATRPTLACGANIFTLGTNWDVSFIQFTGTGTTLLSYGASSKIDNCKIINSSSTASRNAVLATNHSLTVNCELISYRGVAFSTSTIQSFSLIGCYIHDSVNGISSGVTAGPGTILNNIFDGCSTGIAFTGLAVGRLNILGNTIYGSENKLTTGISFATGITNPAIINNIIAGFATGISHVDTTQTVGYDSNNDFYNNTTDVSGWIKSPSDRAVNPSFTAVTQITGTTATTTAGNHLVQSGATFVTNGVTAGRDYVNITSGTGITTGIYGILSVDSETQITTDITLTANATADKAWQITLGHNFLPTGSI